MSARIATAPADAEGLGWTVGKPVVRLPTAARRQVWQPCNKEGRAARLAFRAKQPWPGERIEPYIRAQMDDATALRGLTKTPELAIALAIFAALDDDTQARVRVATEAMALQHDAGRTAAAVLRRRTIGDETALDAALRHLRERDQ